MTQTASLDRETHDVVGAQHWSAGRIARLATMSLVAVAFIFPIVGFILVAFRGDESLANGTGGFLGIGDVSWSNAVDSWNELLRFGGAENRAVFLQWMVNSLVVSIGGAILAVIAAIPAGYALARLRFRFRRTVLVITLLTMVMPNTVLVIPLFLEVNAVGAVGQLWPVLVIMGFFRSVCTSPTSIS